MRMTYVTLHISCFWEHTLANSDGYLSLRGRSYGAFLSTVAREAKRVCWHLVLVDKGQECVEWDTRTSERPTTSVPEPQTPDWTFPKLLLFFSCIHPAKHMDVTRSETWEGGDRINLPSNALTGLIRILFLLPIKLGNNTSRPSCGCDAPACFN